MSQANQLRSWWTYAKTIESIPLYWFLKGPAAAYTWAEFQSPTPGKYFDDYCARKSLNQHLGFKAQLANLRNSLEYWSLQLYWFCAWRWADWSLGIRNLRGFAAAEREMLLIVDNYAAHSRLDALDDIQLELLPPTTMLPIYPINHNISPRNSGNLVPQNIYLKSTID